MREEAQTPSAASPDRAERVMVRVSVAGFWLVLVLLPITLAWLWQGMAAAEPGGPKDSRLLLAMVAVPLMPCFAMVGVGLWHIRKFLQTARQFDGIDLLPPLALLSLAVIVTAASDVSVADFGVLMAE